MAGRRQLLARAAQRARIPYTLGTPGGATIEEIAAIAPDVFWFQLYRFANNGHAVGFDLVRRAAAAGCRTLVLTLDVPVRTTRPREAAVGLDGAVASAPAWRCRGLRTPGWLRALWTHGIPRFAKVQAYAGANASLDEVIAFARREMAGAFTWDEVAKYRDRWKGTLIVKGILHPHDAERAVSLGVDGIVVSSHGGRQIEALPAPIDALPAVVAQVGGRATVLMDSGVRSGTDVVRACALGAAAVSPAKPSYGASARSARRRRSRHRSSDRGDQAALGQLGARAKNLEETRSLAVRHERALRVLELLRRRDGAARARLRC